MSDRRRALIVANFKYQDPGLRHLTAPAQDAKELARVLSNPLIGGFEVETIENARSAVVSHVVEEFFVFSDPRPGDLLLFYFSGHGVTDEEGQLYLATTDTQLVRQSVRRASAVGAGFINSVMQRSRARRQVLILDCCHSGAFAEGMRIKGVPLAGLDTHFQGKGRMVLTASTSAQFSMEGTSEAGGQPSVYTRILVRGLETGEADRDGDGWVNLDELHDYLLYHVRAEAPQQTPTKSGYLEGQLYIARSAVVRPAELPRHLRNALEDPEVLIRQGLVRELQELLQGEHSGLALAARQALVTLRDSDDSFKVRRAAGDCLAADDSRKAAEAELARGSEIGGETLERQISAAPGIRDEPAAGRAASPSRRLPVMKSLFGVSRLRVLVAIFIGLVVVILFFVLRQEYSHSPAALLTSPPNKAGKTGIVTKDTVVPSVDQNKHPPGNPSENREAQSFPAAPNLARERTDHKKTSIATAPAAAPEAGKASVVASWSDVIYPEDKTSVLEVDALTTKINSTIASNPTAPGEFEEVRHLLAEKPQPVAQAELIGSWRCRSIQVDASSIYDYPFFRCSIGAEVGSLSFDKSNGSQRRSGRLFKAEDGTYVFLGALTMNDDRKRPYSALKKEGSKINNPSGGASVGILRKIGHNHLLMVFDASKESYEMYELIR
jgi:uncharacterized caspase-like protein